MLHADTTLVPLCSWLRQSSLDFPPVSFQESMEHILLSMVVLWIYPIEGWDAASIVCSWSLIVLIIHFLGTHSANAGVLV